MSDALCGPSNALQNFQKHTSVDRTLQQDRLTSRQPSAQGFRSQSPRDGILDPEFAAFEANLSGPALPDLQHPAHLGGPAHAHAPANASSGWASDFQNLHISGPPVPQLHRPNVASVHGGWQNEFMNQQQPATAHHLHNQPATNRVFQPAFAPSYPMHNAPMNAYQVPQQAHAGPSTSMHQFDESAFEAAFEQARADMELQSVETPEIEQHLHDVNSAEALEPTYEEPRIGSDTITQSDKQDLQSQIRDADALAQTAGQLLDSVRHEQSEKFQQSNFLALMRRIRDREVEVNGDEFRETTQSIHPLHPLHPGGPYYPGPPYPGHSAAPVDSPDTPGIDQDIIAEEESPRLGTNPYGPGDSNGLYEGWYHSWGLVDRRRPTFCFRGEDQFR